MLKSKYSRFMENLNKKYLAKEEPLTETVFGVQLQDNYRYFEDRENKEALAWMKKQTQIADEFVDKNNLTTKRPANGISPMRWDEIIGSVATKDYIEDELI